MTFAENIKALPAIDHLAGVQLLNDTGEIVSTIENKPGKAGSLAIYAALAKKHGSITRAAAAEGLDLYAEHTASAIEHPGSHPNIDLLLAVQKTGSPLHVRLSLE
jgi:hypothetical protein